MNRWAATASSLAISDESMAFGGGWTRPAAPASADTATAAISKNKRVIRRGFMESSLAREVQALFYHIWVQTHRSDGCSTCQSQVCSLPRNNSLLSSQHVRYRG